MDWDDLRFVLAVAREGSLAKAAARLAVTHTTVGRRLRACEERLGVRLFDRTPEGFVPTAAGRELSDVAENVEADVLAAEGRVKGHDRKLSGPLRVSTMDTFYCGFPEMFASFVDRYPGIELTVTTELDRVSLTRREADVVLRLTNQPPEYLVGRKVGTVQFAVYAAESLIERVGPDAPLADYPWLGWDDPAGVRWLEAWQAEHAPGASTVARFDDNARVRLRAIETGLGVFFLPCFEGDTLPGVRRISSRLEPFAHDVWLLTLRELRSTGRVRAFLDHVVEAFEGYQDALGGVTDSTG